MLGDELADRLLAFAHATRSPLRSTDLGALIGEGRELVAILKASARTARARAQSVDS